MSIFPNNLPDLSGFKSLTKTVLAASLIALLSGNGAFGNDWRLDTDQSNVSFSSLKNASIGEGHRFRVISGQIDKEGRAQLHIDLHSVDTAILIRDERIMQMLFSQGRYAVFQTDLGRDFALKSTPLRQITGTLKLSGIVKKVTTGLRVHKLTEGVVLVFTERPIIIQATDFGLTQGVEALRQIVSLSSIAPAVPVNLILVFREN